MSNKKAPGLDRQRIAKVLRNHKGLGLVGRSFTRNSPQGKSLDIWFQTTRATSAVYKKSRLLLSFRILYQFKRNAKSMSKYKISGERVQWSNWFSANSREPLDSKKCTERVH